MADLKQLTKALKKSLDNFDIDKRIEMGNNETTTRNSLIHPFLEDLLNYDSLDGDFTHEYTADFGDKKGLKVDLAMMIDQKEPNIIIECKSAGQKNFPTSTNFRQLNEYYHYTKSAKIGILTNGVIWNFYIGENRSLIPTPFFTFDITDYDNSDVEMLAKFDKREIKFDPIIEEAEEIHFLDKFDDALFKSLAHPSDDFIKDIYSNMGGKRLTPKIKDKIKDLINSVSVKAAHDQLLYHESKSNKSGVYTTEDEYKAFNVVHTILSLSRDVRKHLDRISYKDLKNTFLIIVDGKQTKQICSFQLKETKSILHIKDQNYELEEVSVPEITKYKKEIIDSALKYLKE
jgi:predicted type IV restriction endonuclease